MIWVFRNFIFDRTAQKYYYAALMSARAVIDSLEFARSGAESRGEVQVGALERLADGLYDSTGILNFVLRGQMDDRERPGLQLAVTGTLNLRCQRCLGKLVYPVAVESRLLLLDGASGSGDVEIDDLDAVAADRELDVWALVEDEVLLAQPMASRHEAGECQAAVATGRDGATSPFAVLAEMKHKQIN
jgi:uncharacterized protein